MLYCQQPDFVKDFFESIAANGAHAALNELKHDPQLHEAALGLVKLWNDTQIMYGNAEQQPPSGTQNSSRRDAASFESEALTMLANVASNARAPVTSGNDQAARPAQGSEAQRSGRREPLSRLQDQQLNVPAYERRFQAGSSPQQRPPGPKVSPAASTPIENPSTQAVSADALGNGDEPAPYSSAFIKEDVNPDSVQLPQRPPEPCGMAWFCPYPPCVFADQDWATTARHIKQTHEGGH